MGLKPRFWELLATTFISKLLGEIFVKIEIIPMVSELRSPMILSEPFEFRNRNIIPSLLGFHRDQRLEI